MKFGMDRHPSNIQLEGEAKAADLIVRLYGPLWSAAILIGMIVYADIKDMLRVLNFLINLLS